MSGRRKGWMSVAIAGLVGLVAIPLAMGTASAGPSATGFMVKAQSEGGKFVADAGLLSKANSGEEIPTDPRGTFSFTIADGCTVPQSITLNGVGDGTTLTDPSKNIEDISSGTIALDEPGQWTVRGSFDVLGGNTGQSSGFLPNNKLSCLKSVDSWSNTGTTSIDSAFSGTQVLESVASLPSTVRSLERAFSSSKFAGNLNHWDVSNVTTMKWLFSGATNFNGDLSSWKTGSVTAMEGMFGSSGFNNPSISSWDTSAVTTMKSMFANNQVFNQPIGGWDVSKVTDMEQMFSMARTFNQDLNGWGSKTGAVKTMKLMFADVTSSGNFNGNIGNWDVSEVTDMDQMFSGARVFNGDISDWDVSNVKNMRMLFYNTKAFTGNLTEWANKTGQVTTMQFLRTNSQITAAQFTSWGWDLSGITVTANRP